jgi:hypothetical protein
MKIPTRILAACILFGIAMVEFFSPGWNGWFREPTVMTEGESRILY